MPLVTIAQGICSLKHVKYTLPGVEDPCVLIDNETKDKVVVNILYTKYNNVYNNIPYDEFEMKKG